MRLSRLVLLLFLAAQFWDGMFTWVAVDSHGVIAEGNVVLATWMVLVGPRPRLLAPRSCGAAAGGVLLYVRWRARHPRRIDPPVRRRRHRALAGPLQRALAPRLINRCRSAPIASDRS